MTSSVLDIYNGALSAVHAKGGVDSLSEASREREVCERWYGLVRNVVQEAAYWPCCQATVRLALKAERAEGSWTAGDPAPQFLYSYYLPADYLRARFLVGYQPFTLDYDTASGLRVLSTNVELAVLTYSRVANEVDQWSPGQQMATIYGLAAHIAGPLTGDKQLKNFNVQLANQILLSAQSASGNAQDWQVDVMPSVFAARGATGFSAETRYLYPLGGLFAGANVDG